MTDTIHSGSRAMLITLDRVTKRFSTPAGEFTAVNDVSLEVERGEYLAVVGASGSGKSTLLGLVSGIDRVTSGTVIVGSVRVDVLSERAMTAWRGKTVGIVFQFFQLLQTLTAVENVMLPMDFCNMWPPAERRPRAEALLARLGVADQANKLPYTLSGGQQQRVAIARALANAPAVLLADEPTGNLDSRTAASILELFAELARDGQTVLMATHDAGVHRVATRIVTIADGCVVDEGTLIHA
jgi:putative ABC transport system ATP-binding protein